jgi:hypothetical protein
MKRVLIAIVLGAAVAAACGSPRPTLDGTPTAPPPRAVLPLPADLAGIPGRGETSVEIGPQSPDGELELGVERDFILGHCGLISPIDIDGSLWDPVGGDNGLGDELNDLQRSELINSTSTVVVLIAPDRLEMLTPLGAVITLTRHDGPRSYFGCD